jgi:uncharacterized protein (TIGR02996 family)
MPDETDTLEPIELGFLETIRSNPRDDSPRLIYADWLEEQGNPRGEFIRLQCAMAGLSEDDKQWKALQKRERALLQRHWHEWVETPPRPFRSRGFSRGFEKIHTKHRFRQAELLRPWSESRLPGITQFASITIDLCKSADIVACFACPLLERVSNVLLILDHGIPKSLEMMRRIAPLSQVSRLEWLNIYNAMEEDCEEAFAPVLGESWREVIGYSWSWVEFNNSLSRNAQQDERDTS